MNKIAALFILFSVSHQAFSFSYIPEFYEVYVGDFNDDGLDNDIYFYGRDEYVLLHGSVITPIQTLGNVDFIFYEKANGAHQIAVEYVASKSEREDASLT